ncbi:Uncharacterised protein [Mycobacteroides abscessus subsp. abscessus]|nr:Uncharacterised protein [Mycobacteroides abscessus subsp. abscessus]
MVAKQLSQGVPAALRYGIRIQVALGPRRFGQDKSGDDDGDQGGQGPCQGAPAVPQAWRCGGTGRHRTASHPVVPDSAADARTGVSRM